MKNYLLDKEFLKELDQYNHKEVYAKITSLSFDELPIEQIEGRITGGSLNIDGSSVVRRTCNLTLVANEVNINDFYWGLTNKFKLEIGLKNFINPQYADIIWFNKGIFCITSFNTSYTTNNYQISISGQDKMCMLNGTLGGSLFASIDFGAIETVEDMYDEIDINENNYLTLYEANKYYYKENDKYILAKGQYDKNKTYYNKFKTVSLEDLTLKQIIKEAVHTYANEPYHNIVINDLEDCGLELLEYRGDKPLYFFFNAGICENMTYNDQMLVQHETWDEPKKLADLTLNNKEINNLVDGFNSDTLELSMVNGNGQKYTIAKVEYGQTAGYRQTDLTYIGELISSVGETLTSVLDKIKNMLGDFEYFYDVNGRFIFQKKKTYVNTTWNTLVETDDKDVYAENAAYTSDVQYSFEDNNLITSFSNNPQLNNLKNDFSVWGVRKGINDKDIPIHARYAIDKKPLFYKAYDGFIYLDKDRREEFESIIREEITVSLQSRLDNFKLKYQNPEFLQIPKRNQDGSWEPGWWDIRDWHDYYLALTQEEPEFTMKWYSWNSIKGCVKTNTLPGFENYSDSSYVWLIIVRQNGSINIQHGSGNPYSKGRDCTKYYSYYDESGRLITTTVKPTEKQYYIPPFSGCSDNHTYLEFLEGDVKRDGNKVYFYTPNFPGMSSFEETVETQIQKEMNEYFQNLVRLVDWREIIYQMSIDYLAHNQDEDFLIKVKENNSNVAGWNLYQDGYTGYEQYYTDIHGFWRDLYDTNPKVERKQTGGKYEDVKIQLDELGNYKIEKQWVEYKEDETDFTCDYYLPVSLRTDEYYKCSDENANKHFVDHLAYWNKNVVLAPETLNFWFEFLDEAGELEQFAVPYIGSRAKSINDSKVSAIYFRETPNIIFTSQKDYDPYNLDTGYVYIWLQDYIENSFVMSSQGKNAKDRIDELLYNHTYCVESVTLQTIPVYHLEPNARIYVHDEDSKINGDYIVSKLSIPFTYNGTMSINATKAVERLL